jgi:hypothetical protein
MVSGLDAALCITKLPKAEHEAAEWQAAMEALLLVAEQGEQRRSSYFNIPRGNSRYRASGG